MIRTMAYFLEYMEPDCADVLTVAPQDSLVEDIKKFQTVEKFDDGVTEERISKSTVPEMTVSFPLSVLSATDSGTVFDFYMDVDKADGMARTFLWQHPTDEDADNPGELQKYVVRFDCEFQRTQYPGLDNFSVGTVKLKILGK